MGACKNMKKEIRIFCLLLTFIFLLCSCQKEKVYCEELLTVGLEYGINDYNDNGYVFLKSADNSSVFFMSEKTKSSMYGENFKSALEATADFAIYISASNCYELAIFECYSKNDIDEILRMCYERADEIKVALRFTEWEGRSSVITVEAYKKYVIFSFTESQERNEDVIEAIKSCLN